LKVEIDYEESQRISELLHSIDSDPRLELHLTDDPHINCSLKCYCRIALKLKPIINRKTAAIFMRGRVYDELFKKPFKTVEKEIKLGVAIGHPDVVEKPVYKCEEIQTPLSLDIPIEAKHTIRSIRTILDISKKWLFQVKLECIYCDSLLGKLAIGELITTLITVWTCKMSQSEFDRIKEQHIKDMDFLQYVIDNKLVDKLIPNRRECKGCFYNYPDG